MAPKKSKKAAEPEAPSEAPRPQVVETESGEQQTIIPGANDWEPPKIFIKPRDQVQLTDKELGEELTRIWRADDPNVPDNIARYSHKERCYKHEATVDQMAMHYVREGILLDKTSDEAVKQKEREKDEEAAFQREIQRRKEEGLTADDDEAAGLRNQFNFSERASQTVNNTTRERSTMTEPPPSLEFSSASTQWDIFDSYLDDMARKKEAEEKKKKDKKAGGDKKEVAEIGRASCRERV